LSHQDRAEARRSRPDPLEGDRGVSERVFLSDDARLAAHMKIKNFLQAGAWTLA
jgi:hypothetical protein